MDHRTRSQIRIPGSQGNIPANRCSRPQVEIGAECSQITRNSATGIDIDLSEQHGNVALDITVDTNSAEHTSNVARGLPLGNGNVVANARTSLIGSGECWKCCGKKNCNSEEPSAHKNLVEQV